VERRIRQQREDGLLVQELGAEVVHQADPVVAIGLIDRAAFVEALQILVGQEPAIHQVDRLAFVAQVSPAVFQLPGVGHQGAKATALEEPSQDLEFVTGGQAVVIDDGQNRFLPPPPRPVGLQQGPQETVRTEHGVAGVLVDEGPHHTGVQEGIHHRVAVADARRTLRVVLHKTALAADEETVQPGRDGQFRIAGIDGQETALALGQAEEALQVLIGHDGGGDGQHGPHHPSNRPTEQVELLTGDEARAQEGADQPFAIQHGPLAQFMLKALSILSQVRALHQGVVAVHGLLPASLAGLGPEGQFIRKGWHDGLLVWLQIEVLGRTAAGTGPGPPPGRGAG